jgi:protein-S-isoprenylcysteine O-methyltransferase Ste14
MILVVIKPNWVTWCSFFLEAWLRWAGVVMGILGLALLWWTHRALGKNFFGGMKIRLGHELVMSGPYRWVRHPLYVAFMVLGVGFALVSSNWLVGASWLGGTFLVLLSRFKAEEDMLENEFGDRYRAYRSRTGAFIPGLLSAVSRAKRES